MSRFRFFPILFLIVLSAQIVFAQDQSEQDAVASALAKYYPKLQSAQINPTPISGVYEVVVDNNQIVYFSPATGLIFVGDLWTPDSRNLTRESKDRLLSEKVKLFPLDKAIKIGDGPNQVIEVTDPDCPFCRHGSAFFENRKDVTRYVFLYPLEKIHPHAEAKSRYILSAPNPAEAYEKVFSGAYDKQPLPAFTDNGMLELHRRIGKEVGVTGTPQYWINGHHLSGFNQQQVEKLLDK